MGKRIEAGLVGAGLRVAIVVSRFNDLVTERLLAGAESTLVRHGVSRDAVDVVWVPGSFEVPQAAREIALRGAHQAIVCLGAVVKGETPHFDHICAQAASGCSQVALTTGVPVSFGVLTCDTMEQALDRAGGKAGNKGAEAALAALEMANLRRALKELA